jgi:hypothetical protein
MTDHKQKTGSLRESLERALEFTNTDEQLAQWLVETGALKAIMSACTCTAEEVAQLMHYQNVRSVKVLARRTAQGQTSRVPEPILKNPGDLWSRPEILKVSEPERVYHSFHLAD